VRRFDQGAAEEDEAERRQEGEVGHHGGGDGAGEKERIAAEHGMSPAADEADEGDDHDQRSRSRFAEREAVDHLARRHPVVCSTAPWNTYGNTA
jgi:hypothetical protein